MLEEADFECIKTNVIADVALGERIDHPDAYPCGFLNTGSNEAYVLATCNVTHPDNWTRGMKVKRLFLKNNFNV